MGAFEKVLAILPEGLARSLQRVSAAEQAQIQEVRLRRNGLLTLSLPSSQNQWITPISGAARSS